MEINSLGQTYFSDYRAGQDALESYKKAADAGENFAELLKKTAPRESSVSPAISAASSSKDQIDKNSKLYEQCLELETFLVKTLISGMRGTVQKSGLINEGFAGKMYEDMLYDEYAKDFTKNANFGLANQAYLQLTGQRGRMPSNL